MPSLLIVDDDEDILSLLAKFFAIHAYKVTIARNGEDMFSELEKQAFDLVILDIMMPGKDGFALCQKLRTVSQVPVIMLTAMGEYTDRVVGLEIGADDYLVKPFDARELLARIKAILRRVGQEQLEENKFPRPVLRFAEWHLDVARRELRSAVNALVLLSNGEFDLLLAFVQNPQTVLTRDQLLDLVRGSSHFVFDRSIDVQVSRLRRKLERDARDPAIIRTVRNGGYIFMPQVTRG